MHRAQDGDVDVGVVVDPHAGLAVVGTHQPPCGEGEEERVELWAVETLPEVLAGRNNDERIGGGRVLDLSQEGGACALPESAFEQIRRRRCFVTAR